MSLTDLIILLLLSTSLLVNVLCLFRYLWAQKSRVRTFCAKFSLSAFAILYSLLALEFCLYFFLVGTSDFWASLATKRWFTKYWHPINSMGYRDREHPPADFLQTTVVFVAGDSLVAGAGIDNYRDRFSDVLQDRLGKEWTVVNIARPGWDTQDEYRAIVGYPYPPHVIVLSYYINDIEGTCSREHGRYDFGFIRDGYLRGIIDRSYVLNFAYWSAYKYIHRDTLSGYFRYLENCFANARVWEAYQGELERIVNHAEDQGAELVVVVFPELRSIERSKALTSPVVDWMNRKKVRVIDLTTMLVGRDPRELVVHPSDGHPSVKLHREVGQLLFEAMRQLAVQSARHGRTPTNHDVARVARQARYGHRRE